jgi:hypothetical protein
MDHQDPNDWQVRALRSWHFAILRFALTRDHADKLGVLAAANEIDRLGRSRDDREQFDFFRRTSAELCEAILHPNQPSCELMLGKYLARIDDAKLKRALMTALDFEQRERASTTPRPKPYSALWRRLPSQRHGP